MPAEASEPRPPPEESPTDQPRNHFSVAGFRPHSLGVTRRGATSTRIAVTLRILTCPAHPRAWLAFLTTLVRRTTMSSYHPAMQKARLADVPQDVHGLISKRTADLEGVSVTEVTFGAGARWSSDLKDYAGTELCELPHVALV